MTAKRLGFVGLFFLSALSINSARALPIDWNGVFGMDTHMISNTCRTSDNITLASKAAGTRNGTQGIANGDCGASFQTYILKLNPTIIVNDGVTLKGELSSGYSRGGFAGNDSTNNQNASGNNSYFYTTSAQNSNLNVNQLYMELYADTALVKIGRMSKHYGLGMIWDNGNDPWDRFFTLYDGVEATMKIGNFSIVPYYAKISSGNPKNTTRTQTDGSPANGTFDVRELGLSAQYDNKNRDLIVSVLYAKRTSERRSNLYSTDTSAANNNERGKTSVTVIEPYVSKKWNKFTIAAEGTLQNGDYGHVYDTTSDSNISTTSYVVETKYELNPKWDLGLNGGLISGDKGSSDKFEATYLHPNYHIAEFMFRYNYAAFNEGGKSIFDNSITNTRFFKLYGNYKSDKWTWKTGFVMAKARETAKSGRSYHHEENYSFNSSHKQSDDMGWELDFGFDYRWNPNVTISGYYGYWKVGEYYAFTNTGDDLSLSSVHGGGLRAMLEF